MATLLPKSHITPNLSVYVAASLGLSALSVIVESLCYSICYRSGQPGSLARAVFCRGLGVLLFPSEWRIFCGNGKCGLKASSNVGGRESDFVGLTHKLFDRTCHRVRHFEPFDSSAGLGRGRSLSLPAGRQGFRPTGVVEGATGLPVGLHMGQWLPAFSLRTVNQGCAAAKVC